MKATAQGRPRGAKLQHRDFGSRQGWRGGAELKKDRNKAEGAGGDFTPPEIFAIASLPIWSCSPCRKAWW